MTRSRRDPGEPPPWTLLVAFMVEEDLVADDLVRLIDLKIMPVTQTVRETVWVHRPSIPDWRALIELLKFKKQKEALAEYLARENTGEASRVA